MWVLVITFLSSYVGTAHSIEFYSKEQCYQAKHAIDIEMAQSKLQINSFCFYEGD